MTWSSYLRRMALELIVFFAVCAILFHLANGRENLATAINTALLATLFYGGLTFMLRHRATKNQTTE